MATVAMLQPELGTNGNPKTQENSGGCWQRLNETKRCLVYMIILLVLIIVALAIFIIVKAVAAKRSVDSKEYCMTRECIESAALLRSAIDPSVDPCQDFYRHACGNFIKKYKSPPEDSWSMINILGKSAEHAVLRLFRSPFEDDERPTVKTMKRTFQACLKGMASPEFPREKLLRILRDNGFGTWPRANSSFDFRKAFLFFLKHQIDSFFKFAKKVDSRTNYVYFGLDDLTYKAVTSSMQDKALYRDWMTSIFEKLGVSSPGLEATRVLNFEQILSELLDYEKKQNLAENGMTLNQFDEAYPGWNLEEAVVIILQEFGLADKNISYVPVVVSVQKAIRKIPEIIDQTPQRTVQSYLAWKFYQAMWDSSGELFSTKKINMAFFAEPTSIESSQARCTKFVQKNFQKGLTFLYSRDMVDQETRDKIRDMYEKSKASFLKTAEKKTWYSKNALKSLKAKMAEQELIIGYPPEEVPIDYLDEQYQKLEIDEDDFIQTTVNILRLKTFEDLKAAGGEQLEWVYDPTEVNAFNHGWNNRIIYSTSILFPPFFQKDRPDYLNYGSIGCAVAHEIGHTFDYDNIKFPPVSQPGWGPEDLDKHYEQLQCLVNQYDQYSFDGNGVLKTPIKVDGNETIQDNVADHVGLTHAYRAYLELEKEHAEPLLPGLNYTRRQLFFLSNAVNMCNTYTVDGAETKDEHAPTEFRVIGSYHNLPEFGEVFGCPLGSPMNPVHKCTMFA